MLSPKQLPAMIRGARKRLHRAKWAHEEAIRGVNRNGRRQAEATRRRVSEAITQLGELMHLQLEYTVTAK